MEGTKERGYLCMNQLLKLENRPDAVFASNDMGALGAMLAIKEAGLRIPHDIAVVGFSNWQFCALVEPQLSSVAQPGLEMGRLAAPLRLRPRRTPENACLPRARHLPSPEGNHRTS